MKQAVDYDLFLCADDSCLVYQHNDISKIEQNLIKNFSNICDWFVDNKRAFISEKAKKNAYYLAQKKN